MDILKAVHSVKTYDEFLTRLRDHEVSTATKFVLARTKKSFSNENVKLSKDCQLHWQHNVPFFHFGTREFSCHQGKDINVSKKKKYAQQRDSRANEDHAFTKRYNMAQLTKKLDCPATVYVTRVIRMPEFKIPGEITKSRKDQTSLKIKKKISEFAQIGEECYIFNLPEIDEHKFHFKGSIAEATEQPDSRVRNYIGELVRQGERSAKVVSKLLEVYVKKEIGVQDMSRSRFFPDIYTIRKTMSRVKASIRNSTIDQEETQIMINGLDSSKHNIVFRPCTNKSPVEKNNEAKQVTRIQQENYLLFVYQSSEMKSLYRRYGGNVILLDATYKTCKYAIPLYFIVVETNVNFQVVGVFITQFETKVAITEALTIFRDFNPDIQPKYGMVDFAAEEIVSLEAVFPSIQVFICSFHREQAWNRWLTKSKNISVPREEALHFLRKIANSCTELEMQEALKNLKEWEPYNCTSLKEYFEGTWIKEIRRWATAFKPADLYLNTNNGVERMHKELKYGYLEGLKNCNLSEIIEVLILQFLPRRYRKYVSSNLFISPHYRKYDDALPKYLHGRPKWFIDHIQLRLSSVSLSNAENVKIISEREFSVPSSEHFNVNYNVSFDRDKFLCSCTCKDFRKERLLCKHVILVGLKFPDWSLEKIHNWLFQNPIFRFDETLDPADSTKQTAQPNMNLESPIEMENRANMEKPKKSELGVISLQGSKRRHIINECNSTIRSIQSMLHNLDDNKLDELSGTLKDIFKNFSSQVTTDKFTGIPVEPKQVKVTKSLSPCYDKLSLRKNKTNLGRVGFKVDMVKAASTINVNEVPPVLKNETGIYTKSLSPCYGKLSLRKNKTNLGRIGSKVDMVKTASTINVNEVLPVLKTETYTISSTSNKACETSNKRKKVKHHEMKPSQKIIDNQCQLGIELQDNIINYAQDLIKTQQSQTSGFQNTLLGQNLSFDITRQGIQILHDSVNNHWVTIRICSMTSIELYDSLGLLPSSSLQKQMAALVHNNVTDSITIKIKGVQQQNSCSNDCGIFAIAFAFSLARGMDPSTQSFDTLSLRTHLKMCLESSYFIQFPQSQHRQKHVAAGDFIIKIYCSCRQPSFKGEDKNNQNLRMAMCDRCKNWFHKKCMNIPEYIFVNKNSSYVCKTCKQSLKIHIV